MTTLTCSVAACTRTPYGKGLCRMHWDRVRRTGDPGSPEPMRLLGANLAERLWFRVDRTGDCWVWTGALNRRGYGVMRRDRKTELAHRIAWEVTHGHPRRGLHVLHRCDNPPCCNPDHLFLGTDADNIADMDSKGRRRSKPLRGESHPNSKLTVAEVQQIRALAAEGASQVSIARRFPVSRATVQRIIAGSTWGHVS